MSDILQQIIDAFIRWARRLTEALRDNVITLDTWYEGMERIIMRTHLAAMIEGLGTTDLPVGMIQAVKNNVEYQLGFLQNFRDVIQAAETFNGGWLYRAESYGASSKVSYWEGKVVDMVGRALPLPAMPAQGTQCLCITTPDSRVFTSRGYIPISSVVPSDLVLTHRLRWRPVLRTFVREPREFDRQAYIVLPDGKKIGCTADHRWLTKDGWQNSKYIDNQGETLYNIPYEQLQKMWDKVGEQEYIRLLHSLPVDMRVRGGERLSSGALSLLQQQDSSQRTMERSGKAQEDFEWNSQSWGGKDSAIRGPSPLEIELGKASRRPSFSILHDRERREEIYLSLSTCLDFGKRGNTGRLPYSPQGRGLLQRCDRELGTRVWSGSPIASYDTRAGSQDACRSREGLQGRGGIWPQATMDLSGLRQSLLELPQEWCFRPEILFKGMLHPGTLLYDLEVADDHSFIIEGVVTHNSCGCEWRIETIDEEAGDYDAYWERTKDDSCQTCIQREEDWYPVRIRGMQLII